MLRNATRICEAKFGILFRYEGDAYTAVATLGVSSEYVGVSTTGGRSRPGRTAGLGRVASTKQTVHIDDTKPSRPTPNASRSASPPSSLDGVRTLLVVPMLKDGELVGAIGIYRRRSARSPRSRSNW